MVNLMKKFKKKRRLSSELHSRWGDTSISFPNQGSWNQLNQPPGMTVNAPGAELQHIQSAEPRHQLPMDPMAPSRPGGSNGARTRIYHPHDIDVDCANSAIPKGYFDESIRHRSDQNHKPPSRGLGINGSRHDMGHDHNASDDESCDEEDEDDEGRDTLGDPGGLPHRGYTTGDVHRAGGRDDYDPYPDRASKSPPLSVTSRMRRVSVQSSTTEHSSSVASKHTSYTGTSSVSAPSLPPDTPRFASNMTHAAHAEKRPAPRPRHREPEPVVRQEMVPGYDELYG